MLPRIKLGETTIEHFVPTGPVPADFTEAIVNSPRGSARLALKIAPGVIRESVQKLNIEITKDIRLEAIASLLKAAHLTLFDMLGYRYALSAGGVLVGEILGAFFLNNRYVDRSVAKNQARNHFAEFANLVRPVSAVTDGTLETPKDGFIYICESDYRWGLIVFLRTAARVHAVLTPYLESPDAAARFVRFLKGSGGMLEVRRCIFEDGVFKAASQTEQVNWPSACLS